MESRHEDRLKQQFPQISFVTGKRGELPQSELEEAVVYVGWPTDDEIRAMPKLQWIQLPSAGADGYVSNPALREQVVVTNSSGVFGVPGAEHAIALMLAFTRQLHVHFRQQAEKIWKRNPYCLEIQDSTVTVIGMGDIGTEICRKAKGLGAYVIAVKRSQAAKPEFVDELVVTADLGEVLERSDFIVSALPMTEQTKGLISAELIKKMKKGAVFINVGRGGTVDEAALIEALQNGDLEGAGLDVTEIEPLPNTSPLWSMDNVMITSHAVGVTPKKADRRTALLVANFEKFLQGEPLTNTVVRARGY
ncbi:D-2-hydroxyacid dehydrogenase [Paenibacillus agricola]|uniref:D-2-hydroxyacid dehydrogenase n=1 Tax=Paenibacillus agricola TaxID=2716264 RepID=A0ABX0J2D0_9BACL|nr:D-2-hydroxyacid dehydrogenase [Paenibacillus agricola]NHN28963.1 D-2-hydroxyacid dehydrogenase [Paenibacillus agricola]